MSKKDLYDFNTDRCRNMRTIAGRAEFTRIGVEPECNNAVRVLIGYQ